MRIPSIRWRLAALLFVVAGAVSADAAETISGEQHLGFDRPESWAMKYFASTTLMTGFGPPRPLHLGSVRLSADAEWIPSVSDAQRVVGFDGTKAEDLNKLPAIGRLRVTVGLGWKLSLTLSYLPPISIAGVEPNLFSLSLGRPFTIARGFTVGVSTYGQVGSVEGSFTCSDAEVRAGADPQRNPFGCVNVSHDHVDMNYLGLEVAASYRIARAHGLEPYTTIALNYMNLGFRVAARYGDVVDSTQLSTDGATFSMTGGLLFPITPKLDIGSELFYSPLTVRRPQNDGRQTVEGLFNVRGMIAYRFN
jgi:hypothetical protein